MVDDGLDEKSWRSLTEEQVMLDSSKLSDPVCWMLLSDEVV